MASLFYPTVSLGSEKQVQPLKSGRVAKVGVFIEEASMDHVHSYAEHLFNRPTANGAWKTATDTRKDSLGQK